MLRSIIARTTARSARWTPGRVDERGERGLKRFRLLGDGRVDVGLVADRAQFRCPALVDRERRSDQPLDAFRRGVGAGEEGGRGVRVGNMS